MSKTNTVLPKRKYNHQASVKDANLNAFVCIVLVMTCVHTDIREAVNCQVVDNRNYDMVYYVDDTNLFSRSNRGLNELLSLIDAFQCKSLR